MLLRSLPFVFAIAFVVFFQSAAHLEPKGPDSPVKALYSTYGVGSGENNHGLTGRHAAILFSKSLLALYLRAVKSGNFDEDFFVQGQDFDLARPVDISKSKVHGASAEVAATLTQNATIGTGKAKVRIDRFVFLLKQEAGEWRIDDAVHNGKSVRQDWRDMISNR